MNEKRRRTLGPRGARALAVAFVLAAGSLGGCAGGNGEELSNEGATGERVGAEEGSLASVLVGAGSVWKYLDDGADPGPGFRDVGFDDGAWKEGPAKLGYGDGDEATTIAYGSSANAKHVTSYFRRSFEVARPEEYGTLRLRLRKDDGAVVYLNGVEVHRSNMPAGTITTRTFASSPLGGSDETTFETVSLPAGSLREGANVIAVEVHQANGTSSDLSFDLELLGEPSLAADPVLVGAGDIATCSSSYDTRTAELVKAIPGTVFVTGDNAYESGTATEYRNCYEPTWGQFKGRTKPTPGNHEYQSRGAKGYYDYFGAAAGDPRKGYYSYDVGTWHVVSLNSNCDEVGGCGRGSAQERWLREDLAAHPSKCTLAYWHHPRWSSGWHGNDEDVDGLWQALYDYDADVILNGHDHDYERYQPLTPSGAVDTARGIVQIVVGTGGKTLRGFLRSKPRTSVVRSADSYGVLKMTLHASSYDFEFVPATGSFKDSGSGECH